MLRRTLMKRVPQVVLAHQDRSVELLRERTAGLLHREPQKIDAVMVEDIQHLEELYEQHVFQSVHPATEPEGPPARGRRVSFPLTVKAAAIVAFSALTPDAVRMVQLAQMVFA